MPIDPAAIQMRHSETGAIRCGDQVTGSNGKPVAHKLENFRFTSPSLTELRQLAHKYGGEITEWYPRAGTRWGKQWQVYSEVDEIAVALPPGDLIIRQDMELWSGRGLERRCDGRTMTRPELRPCMCPQPADCPVPGAPAGYAAEWAIQRRKQLAAQKTPAGCKPLTRFALALSDISDVGVWMLRTRSEEAAAEAMAKAYIMEQARAAGVFLSARCALVQRMMPVDGVLRQYGVPVIRLDDSIRAIAEGAAGRRTLAEQLTPAREAIALTRSAPRALPAPGQSGMEITAQGLADQARAAVTRAEIRPLIDTARRMGITGQLVWAPADDGAPDDGDDETTLREYLTRRFETLPPARPAQPAPAERPRQPERAAPRAAEAEAAGWDASWPAEAR